MKMEEILKLIEAVSASTLTEFKYEENGTKLNLKKEQQKVEIVQNAASIPLTGISSGDFQATVLPQNMAVSGSSENADSEENLEKEPEGKLIIHLWLELSTLHRQRMHRVLSRLVTRSKSDRLSES